MIDVGLLPGPAVAGGPRAAWEPGMVASHAVEGSAMSQLMNLRARPDSVR